MSNTTILEAKALEILYEWRCTDCGKVEPWFDCKAISVNRAWTMQFAFKCSKCGTGRVKLVLKERRNDKKDKT